MQKFILVPAMLLLSLVTYSQESFKNSLENISIDLCSKMVEKGKKKVVVLFVTDINKAQTTAGKYMADVVSFYIVNNQNEFSVFDRENLTGIAEAKKLIAEGYIDVNNAKQLGKILSVEVIVVGNYTILSKTISLTLKALDAYDGFVIAQTMKDLPIDNDAGALLGINVEASNKNNLSNRGFNNIPLSSNENYNNPNTVTKECEQNNTGDICFQNVTKSKVEVLLYGAQNYGAKILTLQPEEIQCFYDIVIGAKVYIIKIDGQERQGQIKIEQCKSKTFIIK